MKQWYGYMDGSIVNLLLKARLVLVKMVAVVILVLVPRPQRWRLCLRLCS